MYVGSVWNYFDRIWGVSGGIWMYWGGILGAILEVFS